SLRSSVRSRLAPPGVTSTPVIGNEFRYRSNSVSGFAGSARFFDIVNGFLIDAVAHGIGSSDPVDMRHTDVMYLAEIILRTCRQRRLLCRPVVDGVDCQA